MKRMLKQSLSLVLLVLLGAVHAWAHDAGKYDWEKERKRYDVTDADKDHPAIILKKFIKYEYYYEDQNSSPVVAKTQHVIMRVNTTDAINSYNKIYIPMESEGELLLVKARTISPENKVVLLEKKDVLEFKDDESDNKYKAFALDGLEAGSEIEYLFITKGSFALCNREYFQSSIPWKNIHFELVSPHNLVFEYKGYNGLPEVTDSTNDERNYLGLEIPYTEGIEDEQYSLYNNSRMRIDYYLAYNKARTFGRVYTLSDAGETMFGVLNKRESSEDKSIKSMLKTAKITASMETEDKIQKLENYLKTNILVYDNAPTTDIPAVLKNKYASEMGILRIYVAAMKALNVDYEIVITSDRDKVKFDPDLDSWSSLDDYFFYFPEYEKYLAPKEPYLRYGIIPASHMANYGLFIKPVTKGKEETAETEVKYIAPLEYNKNYDDIDAKVTFADDDRLKIDITRKFGGYNATAIQPIYPLLTKDKQKQISEELMKQVVPDAEFVSLEAKNVEPNENPLESPFTLEASMKSSAMLERAGNKLLFKIGEVIGPQVEMYQEKDRRMDVENDFNRIYNRLIEFTLPAGYSVKNMDDLKMDVHHIMNGEKAYAFNSDYTVEGSTIKVKVTEFYKEISCPKAQFQQYRSVINAAADFNKITLVLEKK